MAQTEIDVAYVANLARLELSEEEIAEFGPQLAGILAHADKLAELDLDGVEPTSQGQSTGDVTRLDEVHDRMLGAEATLANAPKKSGDQFLMPKVVE